LVIAGSGPELESITGFDEGPFGDDWVEELENRGIKVVDGVLREEAVKVFHSFREKGLFVYNSRHG